MRGYIQALARMRREPQTPNNNLYPLVPRGRYPDNAWELLLGYEQEVFLGARAGGAVARAIRDAEGAAGIGAA